MFTQTKCIRHRRAESGSHRRRRGIKRSSCRTAGQSVRSAGQTARFDHAGPPAVSSPPSSRSSARAQRRGWRAGWRQEIPTQPPTAAWTFAVRHRDTACVTSACPRRIIEGTTPASRTKDCGLCATPLASSQCFGRLIFLPINRPIVASPPLSPTRPPAPIRYFWSRTITSVWRLVSSDICSILPRSYPSGTFPGRHFMCFTCVRGHENWWTGCSAATLPPSRPAATAPISCPQQSGSSGQRSIIRRAPSTTAAGRRESARIRLASSGTMKSCAPRRQRRYAASACGKSSNSRRTPCSASVSIASITPKASTKNSWPSSDCSSSTPRFGDGSSSFRWPSQAGNACLNTAAHGSNSSPLRRASTSVSESGPRGRSGCANHTIRRRRSIACIERRMCAMSAAFVTG